jgi:hypothetical protein
MTAVATPAGAVFHKAVDWHAIKWQKAHSIVRRLQARIVKATQAGRWGKVRAQCRKSHPVPVGCSADHL